jgi:hypothetical protein
MIYKLFLDDLRDPRTIYPTTSNSEWTVVRNYGEFVKVIEANGLPFLVSFDHDLAEEHYRPSMFNPDGHYSRYSVDGTFKEKTGMECAKWLVEYCMNKNLDLPQYNVHSANPVGSANIASYLLSYTKHRYDNSEKN